MRKAKVAALIIGGVSTCIFGGIFGVYATAPVVRSVTPSNDVESIYEVENEELSNAAAVTSIRTTPQTTTSNTRIQIATTTSSENKAHFVKRDVTTTAVNASFAGSSVRPSYMSNYTEAPDEAPTSSYTDSYVPDNTDYVPDYSGSSDNSAWSEPVTDSWTQPETSESDVWTEPDVSTEFVPDAPAEEATEPETEYVEVAGPAQPSDNVNSLPITDEEFIILCNAVGHEAGCNWISTYDKALVVEVIMNRVYSPLYPNTILGVLTQPYQFSGSSSYVYLGSYASYVSQDVKDAVTLYFSDQGSFSHGYYSFYGDGRRNYFY